MPNYISGVINIPNVTGNIVITAVATAVTVSSISATFNQGQNVIYDIDSLDDLKQYLTVTATYSNSSTATVTTYTLSGTLTVGTSTITVSYSGKTTTFNVTVTQYWDVSWDYTQGKLESQTGWTSIISGTASSSLESDGEKLIANTNSSITLSIDQNGSLAQYRTFDTGYGTFEVVCYGKWGSSQNVRITSAISSTKRMTVYPCSSKWRIMDSDQSNAGTPIADAFDDTEYTVRIVMKDTTADIYINNTKVASNVSTGDTLYGLSNFVMFQNGGSGKYAVVKSVKIHMGA